MTRSTVLPVFKQMQMSSPSLTGPSIISPFQPQPASKIPSISELLYGITVQEPVVSQETLQMDSVKRKRKKMMKKHKLRKRRKAQRALKIRLKR